MTCHLDVLYEDNHLLVIVKPAGTLVQGDHTGDPSILEIGKQWLIEKYQKPGNAFLGLVHRLDRPVAGVLVLAKSSKAAARLSAQFRERSVAKSYLAVVTGKMTPSSGTLEHCVRRDRQKHRVDISLPPCGDGSLAHLNYRRLEHRGGRSLMQVVIHTGRHHQIRAQLSFAGYPILGDRKYRSQVAMPERKLALFAHELQFDHPTLRKRMTFRVVPPDEWPWSSFQRYQSLTPLIHADFP